MKNPFKNVLSDGKDNPMPKFGSGVKSPKFDKRTSKAFACGDDYGVGKRTPVGSERVSSKESIPMKSKCFYPEDIL